MHEPDLEKLRRLSLVVGLIVLTYSFAGISIDQKSIISIVGIPFNVAKPQMLPFGLIIVSLYGIISFYYYGFLLKKSPYCVRRDIIDDLIALEPKYLFGKKVPMYFGPVEFETTIGYSTPDKAEEYVNNFPDIFPKFARKRVSVKLSISTSFNEDGDPYATYRAKIVIPRRCRVAAIFQDFDYASPILINIFAISAFIYRTVIGI